MRQASRVRIGRCRGFTLLEVLLTLSMSVVLMILIGGAIQFYARDMNVRDMDVRQVQLAAALLQMIEDDLRATLHTEPIDTSGLELLLTSVGGQAGAGGGEDLSAAGIDSDLDDLMLDEALQPDLLSGAAVLETPGLIGNQFQIQLDLSRLPRLEEYIAFLDETVSDIDDVPSDLKTVTYYVQGADTIAGVQDTLSTLEDEGAESGGGLVRRSLDRASTVYATTGGNLSLLTQTGELLAPEVVGIEFAYWDGYQWQIEWSSDEMGELPLAVQVQISMVDPVLAGSVDTTTPDPDSIRTFTHIVRLPLARPIDESDDSLSEVGI